VNAEIIAVGSELLTPYRMDTNSLYLTEQLNLLGVDVLFKSIVGDDLRRLVAAAQHALFRSDIVVFSGGLGPTEDDLTREAVAEALGVPLHRDPEIVRALEQRFAARGWKMTPNNSKQADIIEGATVLPNPNGTAPGQWLNGQFDGREHIIILLPGPPHEMKALFGSSPFRSANMDRVRDIAAFDDLADNFAPWWQYWWHLISHFRATCCAIIPTVLCATRCGFI